MQNDENDENLSRASCCVKRVLTLTVEQYCELSLHLGREAGRAASSSRGLCSALEEVRFYFATMQVRWEQRHCVGTVSTCLRMHRSKGSDAWPSDRKWNFAWLRFVKATHASRLRQTTNRTTNRTTKTERETRLPSLVAHCFYSSKRCRRSRCMSESLA
jgi:hypothetical protein